MFGYRGIGLSWLLAHGLPLTGLATALGVSMTVDTWEIGPRASQRWALASASLLTAAITLLDVPSPFLYYQF